MTTFWHIIFTFGQTCSVFVSNADCQNIMCIIHIWWNLDKQFSMAVCVCVCCVCVRVRVCVCVCVCAPTLFALYLNRVIECWWGRCESLGMKVFYKYGGKLVGERTRKLLNFLLVCLMRLLQNLD